MSIHIPEDSENAQDSEIFNYELGDEAVEAVRPSRIICSCGHSAKMHKVLQAQGVVCIPPSGYCGCVFPIKAMVVSNGKYFFGTFEGQGLNHPLARNLRKLVESGGSFSHFWQKGCMICGASARLSAIKFNVSGFPDPRGTVTLLVCTSCEVTTPPLDLAEIVARVKKLR